MISTTGKYLLHFLVALGCILVSRIYNVRNNTVKRALYGEIFWRFGAKTSPENVRATTEFVFSCVVPVEPAQMLPENDTRKRETLYRTVDEMLKRVDDYLRSEEAFRNTELPRGEQRKDVPAQWGTEHNISYVPPQRPNQEARRPRAVLTLDSLSSTPQEILAIEHHLHLPQPAPLVGVPSKENINKYCDYHNEKGHGMNDCFHLKQQLELALESVRSFSE
ncbi:hypothetical protein Tco_1034626 [Tanacetum coccineum]